MAKIMSVGFTAVEMRTSKSSYAVASSPSKSGGGPNGNNCRAGTSASSLTLLIELLLPSFLRMAPRIGMFCA
jgi:hypothetical protein